MIIKEFLALPLFTENKQPRFISICMEFIPGAPGLCTDEGNNPGYLIDKFPAMLRVNMAPGRYEQHTFYSDAGRKKYPVFPAVQKHPAADLPGEFFSGTRPPVISLRHFQRERRISRRCQGDGFKREEGRTADNQPPFPLNPAAFEQTGRAPLAP